MGITENGPTGREFVKPASMVLAPSLYEAGFVSAAHSDNNIQITLGNSYQAIEQVKKHDQKNK